VKPIRHYISLSKIRKLQLASSRKCQEGQTVVEFVLLILVLMTLAFMLLFGVRENVRKDWKVMIEAISEDSGLDI